MRLFAPMYIRLIKFGVLAVPVIVTIFLTKDEPFRIRDHLVRLQYCSVVRIHCFYACMFSDVSLTNFLTVRELVRQC